jgi:hypothetical protein
LVALRGRPNTDVTPIEPIQGKEDMVTRYSLQSDCSRFAQGFDRIRVVGGGGSEVSRQKLGDREKDPELGRGVEPVPLVGEEMGFVRDGEASEELVELLGVGDGNYGVGGAVQDESGRESGCGSDGVWVGEAAGDLDDGADAGGRVGRERKREECAE